MLEDENFECLWRAEHAANTAICDSVSTVVLHICLCVCLPAYFRFNCNYPRNKGDRGVRGERETGESGEKGREGSQGRKGHRGDMGNKGYRGDMGPCSR